LIIAGVIRITLNNMATDHNINSILSTSDTFCETLEILPSSPIKDIIVECSCVSQSLSCDCGKISVVYSSIDHINTT